MAALIEFEGAQMVQQLRASGPVENGPQEPVRGRASVSAVLSQLASCKTLGMPTSKQAPRQFGRTTALRNVLNRGQVSLVTVMVVAASSGFSIHKLTQPL